MVYVGLEILIFFFFVSGIFKNVYGVEVVFLGFVFVFVYLVV